MRLPKSEQRKMQRVAAEEFFQRRNHPPTQFQPLNLEEKRTAVEQPLPSDLPPPGTVLDINQSKEILKRLASGDIKQMRR